MMDKIQETFNRWIDSIKSAPVSEGDNPFQVFRAGYKAAEAENMEAVKYATGWDEKELADSGGISDCIKELADARDEQIEIVGALKDSVAHHVAKQAKLAFENEKLKQLLRK